MAATAPVDLAALLGLHLRAERKNSETVVRAADLPRAGPLPSHPVHPIEGFRPHWLRHTAAHRWLAAGGSEDGLMAVAG